MSDAETEIRDLIARLAQGFVDRDADAILACYADDVTCFECHSQFEMRGVAAIRSFLENCLPHMHEPIEQETENVVVETSGDVAFAHYHLRSLAHDAEGGAHAGWLRVTLGLRRTGDGWRIGHAHVSSPFNPLNELTMFGLDRDADPFADGDAE